MGRPTKTERLKEARPLIKQTTLILCKLNFQNLYIKSRRLQLATISDGQDYPDYIHNLWNTMLRHESLKTEANRLEKILGPGDAIELLSSTVIHYQKLIKGEKKSVASLHLS